MDYDMLVNLAMEMGCTLMASGAEIYRVEESLNRLLAAYGRQDAQVFAIPSCLIVSLQGEGSRSVTRMSRIPAHGTDIELLERCNDLCRRLCQQTPPLEHPGHLLVGDALGKPFGQRGLAHARFPHKAGVVLLAAA